LIDFAVILQAGRLRYQGPSSMVVRASRLQDAISEQGSTDSKLYFCKQLS